MTRIEREQMIERYVQGMMPSSEEERFLIEVASDPELRYELKASQVIESAIRKDRSRGAIPTGKMRANIALLAIPGDPVASDPIPANAPTPSGWFSRLTGSPAGMMILVVAGSLLIGGEGLRERSHHSVPTSVEPVEQILGVRNQESRTPSEVTADVAEELTREAEEVRTSDPTLIVRPQMVEQPRPQNEIPLQAASSETAPNRRGLTPADISVDENSANSAPLVEDPTAAANIAGPDTTQQIDEHIDASDTTNSGNSLKIDLNSVN